MNKGMVREALELLISTYGDVAEAASVIGMRPSTIQKILNGQDVSPITYGKIIKKVDALNSAESGKESQPVNTVKGSKFGFSLTEKLNAFIKQIGNIEMAAFKIGIRHSTLLGFMNGKNITAYAKNKIHMFLSKGEGSEFNNKQQERIASIFELYKQEGTLEKVGARLNISRERVRQLLAKGQKLGLFDYRLINNPKIPRDKLISDIRQYRSLHEIATKNQITYTYLKKLFKKHRIGPKILSELVSQRRQEKCASDFQMVIQRIGRFPTATDLQRDDPGHALYNRILRYWGSIDNLRASLNIPKPPQGNPRFREDVREALARRVRLASVLRNEHLGMIKDSLQNGPLKIPEVAMKCGFRVPRTTRLINILIGRKELKRIGIGKQTSYELINK